MENHMKRIASILLTFVVVAGASAASMAQTATPRVNTRERHQQRRIRQGVRSGELTKREAAKLEHQQAKTEAAEAAAKADGRVTSKERRHLRNRTRHTNRSIYRQKHDAQKRNP
jgi:Ni/Co efflux regulator RcnB